jgi:hypothetical protein
MFLEGSFGRGKPGSLPSAFVPDFKPKLDLRLFQNSGFETCRVL